MPFRELTTDVVRSFHRNGLGNFGSAIAFRVILALVPFLLFLFALMGYLHLEEIWRSDVAPELKKNVSGTAFRRSATRLTRSSARSRCGGSRLAS
jgi:uncharacterized BrkB/YihY/UPF0761 family membrane protein